MVKNALYVMRERYFNALVVKVQTRWRGYYVRKYVHNYYDLKKHLKVRNNREKNKFIGSCKQGRMYTRLFQSQAGGQVL